MSASASSPRRNLAAPTDIIHKWARRIARREAKRLVYMTFRFSATAQKHLADTDKCVRVRQIPVQRQRPLAFSNALLRALRNNLDYAQYRVGESVLWDQGQDLRQLFFRPCTMSANLSLLMSERPVDTSTRAMPTSASILAGSSANARSKKPRALRHVFGSWPLM